MKPMKLIRRWSIPILITVLAFILLKVFFLFGYVPTESMEPTLPRNSLILASRIYGQLQVGDIIVFAHNGQYLVKRIAAVEGDTVEHNGKPMVVPEESFYVLGDNVINSHDSRYWEYPFVSRKDVKAKLLLPITSP